MKLRIIFLFTYCLIATANYAQDSLQLYYTQGIEALKAEDYQLYLQSMDRADRIRPNHPTLVFHLAHAYALNNQPEKVYQVLHHIIMMNSAFDYTADSLLASSLNETHLTQLQQLTKTLNEPIQHSTVYKSIDLKSLHPEGLTFDDSHDTFYFGGVHDRSIIKVTGDKVETITDYNKNKDIYAVMGIDYDTKNKLLWVCTAALPEMVNYNDSLKGHSSIMAIDLENQTVVQSKTIDNNNIFGDLIINKQGKVFISDGAANAIYTISAKEPLTKTFDFSDKLWNLQGIAFNESEDLLYLSDYISGLHQYNISNQQLTKIKLPDEVSEKGFDGLYFYKNSLIGVQNGTTPKRTWQLFLDASGTEVTKAEVIDQALEMLNEPTQGVIRNNAFYYIANSPWGFYKEGELDVQSIKPAIILKYDLE